MPPLPPPTGPTSWDTVYIALRRRQYGPLKACQEANEITGESRVCTALGREPRPLLYCGCNSDKESEAATWLREKGDGYRAGSDKLAHCYAYCVAASWLGPLAPLLNLQHGFNDDDPADTEANRTGLNLGMSPELLTYAPRKCPLFFTEHPGWRSARARLNPERAF